MGSPHSQRLATQSAISWPIPWKNSAILSRNTKIATAAATRAATSSTGQVRNPAIVAARPVKNGTTAPRAPLTVARAPARPAPPVRKATSPPMAGPTTPTSPTMAVIAGARATNAIERVPTVTIRVRIAGFCLLMKVIRPSIASVVALM